MFYSFVFSLSLKSPHTCIDLMAKAHIKVEQNSDNYLYSSHAKVGNKRLLKIFSFWVAQLTPNILSEIFNFSRK